LHSIKRDHDDCVVLVLGGTGSAILIGDDNGHDRIGGYGHLLGDEGSAYHLAITALKQIIRQFEQGDSPSPLARAILQEIGAKDHLGIKDFVYANTKQTIAELARFLATYALQGDPEAVALFRQEGELLADQTMLALKRVTTCQRVNIGFRGSFLLQAPFVQDVLIQRLNEQHVPYVIDKHPVDPVVGAYHLGLRKLLRGDKI
jgi:N-acetylglucosamine kinase-like BadF-type ATPase